MFESMINIPIVIYLIRIESILSYPIEVSDHTSYNIILVQMDYYYVYR